MEPEQSVTGGTEQCSSIGDWYFPLLLVIALLILLAFAQRVSHHPTDSPRSSSADWTPSPRPDGEIVSLTIDFGNGATKDFSALAWRPQMTVADLMEAAKRYRPGIQFKQVGSGESGFLSSVDGLANEGAGGRNWLYRVDDRHAHVSFCLEELEPGMHVLWTFTGEEYNVESAEE